MRGKRSYTEKTEAFHDLPYMRCLTVDIIVHKIWQIFKALQGNRVLLFIAIALSVALCKSCFLFHNCKNSVATFELLFENA